MREIEQRERECCERVRDRERERERERERVEETKSKHDHRSLLAQVAFAVARSVPHARGCGTIPTHQGS